MCYTVAVLSIYIHSVTKVPYLSPEVNKISLEESVRAISPMNSKVSKEKVTTQDCFQSINPVLKERQLSSYISDTKGDRWNSYLQHKRSMLPVLSSRPGRRRGYSCVSFPKMGDIGIHIACMY